VRLKIFLIALSGFLASSANASNLIGRDPTITGTVTFTPAARGVLIRIEASGLPEGWHAVHFHAKGDCSDVNKFQKSGGHVHRDTSNSPVHGLLNQQSNDDGDLPNIYADNKGVSKVELFSTFVSFGTVIGRSEIRDTDGAALVIHAFPDDYTTQPIGNAGPRIACALVE
jgi:Cu-Zn family superoxide dismutase